MSIFGSDDDGRQEDEAFDSYMSVHFGIAPARGAPTSTQGLGLTPGADDAALDAYMDQHFPRRLDDG